MDIKEEYDEIQNELRFLIGSTVRLKILTYLLHSPSTIKEIYENTNLNYTSITSNLNKLEEKNFLRKEKDKYYVKSRTKIKLMNILCLNDNLRFLNEYSEFLNNHIIKNKELEALKTLPPIMNSELIRADNINPYRATEKLEEIMRSEGKVNTICVFLHPNYEELLKNYFETKSESKIIVSPAVAEYLMEHVKSYRTEQKILCKSCYAKILKYPINLTLTVTEKELAISFFRNEGIFDKNAVFYTTDKSAIKWGLKLFSEFESLEGEIINIKKIVCENNNQSYEGD